MPDYNFIFSSDTTNKSATVPVTPTTSNVAAVPNTTVSNTQSSMAGLGTRVAEGVIRQTVISPLNSATGGLASPIYSAVKVGMTGGAIGAAVGGIVIAGINLAITKIKERVAKMEAKAEAANNRDNVLLAGGLTTEATFYKGSFRGVRKTDRS